MIVANDIFLKLEEYQDFFYHEASILNYAKCELLRNDDLDDFYINGNHVTVNKSNDGYLLYFREYQMEIKVYDRQIISFKIDK